MGENIVSITVFDDATVGGKNSDETAYIDNIDVLEDGVDEPFDATATVDNVDVLEFAIFDDTTINGNSDLGSLDSDATNTMKI